LEVHKKKEEATKFAVTNKNEKDEIIEECRKYFEDTKVKKQKKKAKKEMHSKYILSKSRNKYQW